MQELLVEPRFTPGKVVAVSSHCARVEAFPIAVEVVAPCAECLGVIASVRFGEFQAQTSGAESLVDPIDGRNLLPREDVRGDKCAPKFDLSLPTRRIIPWRCNNCLQNKAASRFEGIRDPPSKDIKVADSDGLNHLHRCDSVVRAVRWDIAVIAEVEVRAMLTRRFALHLFAVANASREHAAATCLANDEPVSAPDVHKPVPWAGTRELEDTWAVCKDFSPVQI